MTEQKEALKPCPFCGGRAELSYYTRGASPEIAGHYVECEQCAAGGPTCDVGSVAASAKAEAIAAWNTRADEAELATLRAKLAIAKEALEEIASHGGTVLERPHQYNKGWSDGRFRARKAACEALAQIDALTGGDNE